MPNHWILVGSPGNFAKSRALGWTVQGIKSRHRKKAEQMHAGDTFIYYLTGVQAFAGIVEATSDYWEDHDTPIWQSKELKKATEDYPFRISIAPLLILDEPDWLPAITVVPALEYPKRWPVEHWHLAFQGNVHKISDADHAIIAGALAARAPVGIGR
ncbi:MAG: EVE domain-containing protein [Thermomicrobiales bacterium]